MNEEERSSDWSILKSCAAVTVLEKATSANGLRCLLWWSGGRGPASASPLTGPWNGVGQTNALTFPDLKGWAEEQQRNWKRSMRNTSILAPRPKTLKWTWWTELQDGVRAAPTQTDGLLWLPWTAWGTDSHLRWWQRQSSRSSASITTDAVWAALQQIPPSCLYYALIMPIFEKAKLSSGCSSSAPARQLCVYLPLWQTSANHRPGVRRWGHWASFW